MTVFGDMEKPPDPPPKDKTNSPCPRCGQPMHVGHGAISGDAQQRICELELQVTILTAKASTAVDKAADYEDELRQLKTRSPEPLDPQLTTFESMSEPPVLLRSASQPLQPTTSDAADSTSAAATDVLSKRPPLAQGRFPSFPFRKGSSWGIDRAAPPTRRESDLEAALAREQSLRQEAEVKLTEVNGEIEELSMQLFQQANDMVATERRARARLEERVKVLEQRDGEKRKRLERLEEALRRIERTRNLLAGG